MIVGFQGDIGRFPVHGMWSSETCEKCTATYNQHPSPVLIKTPYLDDNSRNSRSGGEICGGNQRKPCNWWENKHSFRYVFPLSVHEEWQRSLMNDHPHRLQKYMDPLESITNHPIFGVPNFDPYPTTSIRTQMKFPNGANAYPQEPHWSADPLIQAALVPCACITQMPLFLAGWHRKCSPRKMVDLTPINGLV